MTENKQQAYIHDAYETNVVDGETQYISQTTPSSTPTVCEVVMTPYVVPIIFIPGIMGSNLVNGAKKVWFPPNAKLTEAFNLIGQLTIHGYFRSAATRQEDLDPKNTKVSPDGNIYIKKGEIKLSKKEAKERGWGTCWWDGYGKILVYLEKYLNDHLVNTKSEAKFKGSEEWEKIVDIDQASTTEKIKQLASKWLTHVIKDENGSANAQDMTCLTVEQFNKLGHVSFPVYACGYNWLQSNEDSAKKVIETMQQIKQKYEQASSPKFLKFIIVSHSMGGLVTRSIVQQSVLNDAIGGVVHGVMPSSGAPTVYQRIVNGWEGQGVFGKMAAWIFGHTSKRMTAVLSNAPGALQLLPFANFRNNNKTEWLNIQTKKDIISIPTANQDVYEEIYKKQGIWWEMINPDFIDPAGILKVQTEKEEKKDIIEFYQKNIEIVKDFQKAIADSFHDITYAHYGSDPNHKAYGEVTWVADESSEQVMVVSPQELLTLGSTSNSTDPFASTDDIDSSQTTATGDKDTIQDPFPSIEQDATDQTTQINYHMQDSSNPYKDDGVRRTSYGNNQTATFNIEETAQSEGDGTVCYQSGQDVRAEGRKLKQTFIINGYEHSESYNHPDVQLNTIYCIAKIIDDIVKTC